MESYGLDKELYMLNSRSNIIQPKLLNNNNNNNNNNITTI